MAKPKAKAQDRDIQAVTPTASQSAPQSEQKKRPSTQTKASARKTLAKTNVSKNDSPKVEATEKGALEIDPLKKETAQKSTKKSTKKKVDKKAVKDSTPSKAKKVTKDKLKATSAKPAKEEASKDSAVASTKAKKSKARKQKAKKLSKKVYEKELRRLQVELVKMQEWVKAKGLKIVVIFEGRDAAGKGGAIKRIVECLNPRGCKIVALGTPTEREKTQWYFQRYISHLPAGGEIALFDRSWYNRAGVERVMGFCTHDEYVEFIRTCPEFEHMLQRSGIILVKYWFSVSDDEQEKRFQERIKDPIKRWKISPMDLEARARWVEYSKAKDDMFAMTDTTRSPWYVVEADDKKRARLNCINHLLSKIPYQDLPEAPIKLPPRQKAINYERPPMDEQKFVPELF